MRHQLHAHVSQLHVTPEENSPCYCMADEGCCPPGCDLVCAQKTHSCQVTSDACQSHQSTVRGLMAEGPHQQVPETHQEGMRQPSEWLSEGQVPSHTSEAPDKLLTLLPVLMATRRRKGARR
jgi:hypothetical protein